MRACDRPILDSKGVRGRSSWISSHCSRLRGLRLACTSANSLACLSIRSGSSDSSYCIHQTPLLNIQNSKPLLSIKVDSSNHCTKVPIWCGSYLNGTTRSRAEKIKTSYCPSYHLTMWITGRKHHLQVNCRYIEPISVDSCLSRVGEMTPK